MREQMTVTRVAGRHNAVEEINAASDTFNNVARRADAHQVARLVLRHIGLDRVDDVVHHLRRLADRKTADGVAIAVNLCNLLHVPDAQILKGRTLVDAEKHLPRVDGIRQGV